MTNSAIHAYAAVVAALVGLVAGSFGGVVIDRVPKDESIVRPPSHCDSCGMALVPRDNIPIVSYVALGGRCRNCRARIPARVLAVEVVTAAIFALIAFRLPTTLWALPAYCVGAAGLVMLSAIDLSTRRLPTPVVYWTGAIAGSLLVIASAGIGDFDRLLQAAIGAVACFFAFFAVFFVAPKGMGFGDVRLATICGGLLGWLGLRLVPFGVFCGFVLASIPALVLVILGRANRKTQIPFGPYLALGTLVGVCFGPAILKATGLF